MKTPRLALRLFVLTLTLLLSGTMLSSAQASPAVDQSRRLAQLAALTPEGLADRLQAHAAARGVELIDPSDYVCSPSLWSQWRAARFAALPAEDLEFLELTAADILASFDITPADVTDPFYGLTYDAGRLHRTFGKAMNFWTPSPTGMSLVAMHSEVTLDVAKVTRVYASVGLSVEEATQYAELVAAYVGASEALEHGHSPLLSLGAFTAIKPFYPVEREFIALGDGMLKSYAELGYADVAPRIILAHEFGHAVEGAAGYLVGFEQTPENNRHLELLSDAMASYFAAHPRGLSMQNKRVEQFVTIAASAGGCDFDNPSHHGTPDQRGRAAAWATSLVDAARPKSTVLTFSQFLAAFDQAYPTMVAPDA